MKKTTIILALFALISCEKTEQKESVSADSSYTLRDSVKVETKTEIAQNNVHTQYSAAENDTIVEGGITFIFEPCPDHLLPLKVGFTPYYKLKDSLARKYANTHERAIAFETIQMRKYRHLISRNDSILTLSLSTGEVLRLVDQAPGQDNSRHYLFEEYVDSLGTYLVYVQFYEGGEHLLVSKDLGEQVSVLGEPQSYGNRLLCFNGDLVAGYGLNAIQYLGTEDGTYRQLALFEISNWEPVDIRWVNDKQFIVKKNNRPADGTPDGSDITYSLVTIQE